MHFYSLLPFRNQHKRNTHKLTAAKANTHEQLLFACRHAHTGICDEKKTTSEFDKAHKSVHVCICFDRISDASELHAQQKCVGCQQFIRSWMNKLSNGQKTATNESPLCANEIYKRISIGWWHAQHATCSNTRIHAVNVHVDIWIWY